MRRVCSTCGENGRADRILVGKPEEKKHLEKTRRNGRIILKCNFKSMGWDMGCID
jgi:hypothetical protein